MVHEAKLNIQEEFAKKEKRRRDIGKAYEEQMKGR